ncbi:hypothetical protein P3T76_004833 [Phytophthora citrophthora]|uniref:Uncharacterized protein n=1 Tax=Phytophthora citrophthora TaxID=4793 RepID=A0AAD9GRL6_9STRA|nr:hypothetical protein P3T76_004833 [Phytophthora citrophthora]
MGPPPRLGEATEQYNTWNYYYYKKKKKRRSRGAAIVEVAAPLRERVGVCGTIECSDCVFAVTGSACITVGSGIMIPPPRCAGL